MAKPDVAEARSYAAIVIDAASGTVLFSRNADDRNYPASLTKMMTLYMVFEALEDGRLHMTQRLPVSARAAGMPPSKLGLKRGQTISVSDAVYSLITKSANDAAVVLAEALGSTEFKFSLMMTERAHELGMNRTTFRNASGLPNRRQLSTARDMARLSQALVEHFPQYYDLFSTQKFRYGKRTYKNHNNLLRQYTGTDGIKTGYIRASGFNLAASVVRNGRRLIAVVFGGRTSRSRDAHMMDILNRSFTRVAQLDPPATPPLPPRKPNGLVQLAGIDEIVEAIVAGNEPPGGESAAAQPVSAAAEQGSASDWVSVAVPAPPTPPDSFSLAPSEQWAKGGYGVQVGAYRDNNQARRAAKAAAAQAPHLLMHTHVRVSPIKGRKGPIYRARLVGLTREHAEEACRLLSHQGRDCLAVKIDTAVEIALNE